MTLLAEVHRAPSRLFFSDIPDLMIPFQRQRPLGSQPSICLHVTDSSSGEKFPVHIQEIALQNIGLSVAALKDLKNRPEQIPRFFKNVSVIRSLLERAAPIAAKHLDSEPLQFFQKDIAWATEIISSQIKLGNTSQHLLTNARTPGIYLGSSSTAVEIFIDLEKTEKLGSGTFGEVSKALWLTAGESREKVVAKKVVRDKTDKRAKLDLIYEMKILTQLVDKRGIINLIGADTYRETSGNPAIFMPLYECSWRNHTNKGFPVDIKDLPHMALQLLDGLRQIAEKGIHGDIHFRNILLKRDKHKKIEVVLSDFGTFRAHGLEEYGLSSPEMLPPEYYAEKIVSSMQDVWALALLFLEKVCVEKLPHRSLTVTQMPAWTSGLKPGWVFEYLTYPEVPPFFMALLNDMLDPRQEHRLPAQEAFERQDKELATYQPPRYSSTLGGYNAKEVSLKVSDVPPVASQLLSILRKIANKGIHGSLTPGNIYLGRDIKGYVKAICTIDTFHILGQEKREKMNPQILPPEYYHENIMSPKQDVWALGLALYQSLTKKTLPNWSLNEKEMSTWTSGLKPGWVLEYPSHPNTPFPFLELLNDMLDPRAKNRPTAEEAWERCEKGQARLRAPPPPCAASTETTQTKKRKSADAILDD